MQDFNSIYSDYHSAFSQGHHDGVKEAEKKTQQDVVHSALDLAKEFATQIAMYQTFIKYFEQSKQQDTQKSVKKLHSTVVQQKVSQLKEKIQNIISEYFQSDKTLHDQGLSIEYFQYDKKDLKSKFQTIVLILGIKQYEKKALKFIGKNPASAVNMQSVTEDDSQDIDF